MFAALALTFALGAPVPPPTAPIPAGTPPRMIELKPDAKGKITLMVSRTEIEKVPVQKNVVGQGIVIVREEVHILKNMMVELGDVNDLTITTADGKKLNKEEAIKKLAAGAVVVVSSDGKPVSPVFLKALKDETLVLASPELIGPQHGYPSSGYGYPGPGYGTTPATTLPIPAAAPQSVPAVAPAAPPPVIGR